MNKSDSDGQRAATQLAGESPNGPEGPELALDPHSRLLVKAVAARQNGHTCNAPHLHLVQRDVRLHDSRQASTIDHASATSPLVTAGCMCRTSGAVCLTCARWTTVYKRINQRRMAEEGVV